MENIGFNTNQTLIIITKFQLLNTGIAYLAINKSWIGIYSDQHLRVQVVDTTATAAKDPFLTPRCKSINPTAESLEEDPSFDQNVKAN